MASRYTIDDHEKMILNEGCSAHDADVQCGARPKKSSVHPALFAPAACSSSFLALHDACVDLQRGRIDYAMVGGASALLRPATTVAFNQLQ